jgi:NAD-dependent deacetylase
MKKPNMGNNDYFVIMSEDYASQINTISDFFKSGCRIVILTGAGMSEESGIPTFRGKGGLWEKYDPEVVATAEAIQERPRDVWEMHNELRQTIAKCKPNAGHIALATLEKYFKNVTIITQNVDNFHQDAGSESVLELHGNAWRVLCTVEGISWEDRTVPYDALPPLCSCGAVLRPDVVFFGEALDKDILDQAFFEAGQANIMLVIGTSYVVYPAAYLPMLAKQNGALLIEINIEPTPFTEIADVSIIGKAGKVLSEFIYRLRTKLEK